MREEVSDLTGSKPQREPPGTPRGPRPSTDPPNPHCPQDRVPPARAPAIAAFVQKVPRLTVLQPGYCAQSGAHRAHRVVPAAAGSVLALAARTPGYGQAWCTCAGAVGAECRHAH